MPLPLIFGAIALGTAVFGAKKGYDGYQKHSEADDIINNVKSRYSDQKTVFDRQEKDTQHSLKKLGELELEIGKKFHEFKEMADELLKKLNKSRKEKLEFKIPQHKLQKITEYSYSAIGVLSSVVGAGAAGAATGFAVYGGVMAFAAASTGTAISSLAGAAATNATLAAIGGGSLATGGLGMAGGTAILSAAVAGPILAIAGWAYNSHGEEALNNAYKARREANEAIEKLKIAAAMLLSVGNYIPKVENRLVELFYQFNKHFDALKEISRVLDKSKNSSNDVEFEISKIDEKIMNAADNGFAIASILTDIISTPLFIMKEVGGKAIINKSGMPEMEIDINGLMILNSSGMDDALSDKRSQYSPV